MKKMDYPLHLGVTEAGDGEDARIKSAIGIGSLLLDGLGILFRYHLPKTPFKKSQSLETLPDEQIIGGLYHLENKDEILEEVDPFSFSRRQCDEINLSKAGLSIGPKHPPSVLAKTKYSPSETAEIIKEVAKVQVGSKDTPVEGFNSFFKTFLRTTRFGYSSFFFTRGNPLHFN